MVRDSLVGLDVEMGHRILGVLDAARFPVPVALWIRRGDEDKWRLLLATPLYDRLGPGRAYRKLVDTLWDTEHDWVHSPVQLDSTRKPLIRALRQIFGKTASVSGMRFGGQMIGNTWVDDAYVYRIR